MSYKQYLKDMALAVIVNPPLDGWEWRDVKDGMKAIGWAVFIVLLRAIILVTYPVSVPLLAYASMASDRRRRAHWEAQDRAWLDAL